MELQDRDAAPPSAGQTAASYLPGLDGLRALSVLAVLVYHANSAWLPGGFLGVEVFFVISGFIITRGLAQEWLQDGRIAVISFWGRRARRLLPALFILFVGELAYAALFDKTSLPKLREDVGFAAVYVTNWHLIFSNQTYFDSWNHPSFLRHLWSLAIEEQFYLVWPLVLFGALKLFKARITVGLIIVGAIASYTAMALLATGRDESEINRLYYGTDTRIGALLIGSALGFSPSTQALSGWVARSRLISFAGVIALGQLCLFAAKFEDRSSFVYQGGFLLATLMAALVILSVNNPKALTSRLLGLQPLRWIGVRSYGIYLYHFPILLLTWPDLTASVPLLLLQLGATLVIADISYRFVELPIRRGILGRAYRALTEHRAGWRQGFAAGFAAAAVSMVVVVLGFVAIRAQPDEVPELLGTTQVRFVSPSVAQDVSSRLQTISPNSPEPAPTDSVPTLEPPPEAPLLEEAPPAAEAAPPAEPTPEEVAAANERCKTIRGRAYESDDERAWFLANCVRQQPVRQNSGGGTPPAPLPTFVATGTVAIDGGVSAIGDSVMVGAGGWLAATLAGIDIDAAVGRQVSQAVGILQQRVAEGTLARTVVLQLGNNGTFTDGQFDQLMAAIGPERRVFFINLHVPRDWQDTNNNVIAAGVARHANAALIDWHAVVAGHDELFAADGVHVGASGARLYVDLVVQAVTQ